MFNKYRLSILRKNRFTAILLAAALTLILSTIAFAALFNISTTDNSVNEWFNQGVPVFQTDPVGDVAVANEDIINTWVAAEDANGDGSGDTINFLLEVNGSPALSTLGRVAVASLDCNNNNVHEEGVDRLIIYNPLTNFVEIRNGDQTVKFGPPGAGSLGQRVNQYIEWGVDVSLLGGGQFDEPDGHCSGEIGVLFVTVNALAGGAPIDQTVPGPFKGINIPTAVSMHSFNATSSMNTITIALLAGLVLLGALSGAVILQRRKQA